MLLLYHLDTSNPLTPSLRHERHYLVRYVVMVSHRLEACFWQGRWYRVIALYAAELFFDDYDNVWFAEMMVLMHDPWNSGLYSHFSIAYEDLWKIECDYFELTVLGGLGHRQLNTGKQVMTTTTNTLCNTSRRDLVVLHPARE